ncbi:uncharacterized protein LOC125680466 [Ostrea edulis]|uniref:uncharacterized protein LOC125680466 n=1 Tax=Ostrea edulis TaxID=37623 RepID=UPI0020964FD0|nr:uncharacterized protein LOC125680466 [Ostrea edulis]
MASPPQTGVPYLAMNSNQGPAPQFTLVNMGQGGNNYVQAPAQNQNSTTNLDVFMWVLTAFSTVVACPIGIFSICYAYMSKNEAFYPMRRYYRFTAMLVAAVAVFSFVITVTWTMAIFARYD